MMVADADGFRTIPPRRSGQQLGDFIQSSRPEPRDRNRFQPFSVADWQDVARRVETPKLSPSSATPPPSLSAAFPPLSCSTPTSSATPSALAAPASGQGEVIAGRAHSQLQHVSSFSSFDIPVDFISAHDPCRHVGLSLEDSQVDANQRRNDRDCKVVGNGGDTRQVVIFFIFLR